MPRERAQVKEARRDYQRVNHLYHRVGDAAAGKPRRSRAQRDYAVVKAERNRLGRRLAKLTGRRARK